jgi:formylglycine-generating enzyme required for sulfatase activity
MNALPPALFDAVITRLNAACPPKPGGTFQDAAHLPEMVVIPSGSFIMGSPETEPGRDRNEGPQHQVQIGRFAIGKYPVTQRQWHAVMGDNPSYFSSDNIESNADRPVEQVSWRRASVYTYKLAELTGRSYRLPSEAEWEYACRAGATTAYPWGNTISSADASFNCPDEAIGTSSVYGGRPNVFGLHDMIGNVWEIVADDDHDDYTGAPTDGSVWKVSQARRVGDEVVKRGGSWDLPAEYVRCATRSWADPDNGDELTGFRVAMSLPPDDGNYVEQVVQGEVDPNGERLTLVYGDMNSDDWDGGLPVVRLGKIHQGVLTCQFLVTPETLNVEDLLDGACRAIEQVLVRPNCLPPWEYAQYRCGGFSNVYGEWHWSYMPDPAEALRQSQLPGNVAERRQWFDAHLTELNQALHTLGETPCKTCPCCGYPTLEQELTPFQMCLLCWWEDDGQDDPHADEVWPGPNGGRSLTKARNWIDIHGLVWTRWNGAEYINDPERLKQQKWIELYDALIGATDYVAAWQAIRDNEPEGSSIELSQALNLNSVKSEDSPPHQEQWEPAEDDTSRRNQLRAEIMAFREEVNRSETMFRVSATWWRRKRWLFVLMAVGTLFFGFPGALACLATIGMMMYIDPMGKASRQEVAAEICLILSKELAALLQNEPDNIHFMEGKLAALKSLRAELIHLQQDTAREAFEDEAKRYG